MPVTYEPDVTVPDGDALASGDGPSFRRILVPIRLAGDAAETLAVAARVCRSANGVVRLLHVRIYDPPVRNSGRFYPQTAGEAAAVLDEALLLAWGNGLRATTAVVAAPRGEIAAAIAGQASAWPADMIVMTRRPGPAIWRMLSGSVPDKVMRIANCPVLAVHPRPKAAHLSARDPAGPGS
jgi:nucleotide-binding universal stress UspA family protein